jgi:NADPH:quinone reductase
LGLPSSAVRNLKVIDLLEPEPGPGEVRIRVHAVAVNPADITFRSGGRAAQLADRAARHIPGMDVAGVVDKVVKTAPDGSPSGTASSPRSSVRAAQRQLRREGRGRSSFGGASPGRCLVPEASTLLLNATAAQLSLDALALPPAATVAVVGGAGAEC